jgi:hypothetical protein
MDENHAKFQERNLHPNTLKAEALIARWFNDRATPTIITKKTIAPTAAEWKKHADNGDLFHTINGRSLRGEVKYCKYDFSSQANYRFPTLIVCAVHTYKYADPRPIYVAHVSSNWQFCAIVRAYSDSNWVEKDNCYDRHYDGHPERWYYIPTSLVYFLDLQDPKKTVLDFLYAPP